jgi:glucuronate isomerase
VITAFRPDTVVDPESGEFAAGLAELAALTREDTNTWIGYLRALAARRRFFASMGATSTDHGHATAATFDLPRAACEALFAKARAGALTPAEAEQFRGQMLTEMALMSLEDGLVMQIHPGSLRNHNGALLRMFGRDRGGDIPTPTNYVHALRPLLERVGNDPRLTLIVFTLDESTYARELAPLAGHYPALKVGPAWWFLDSPEGMRVYRERMTETAGFYNGVGFNDDTRAFLSIPARHDMARRVDCAFLSKWVGEHRLEEDEAIDLAVELAYGLAKRSYKL